MKITLDIDQLLQEGKITAEEYARLKLLASETTASLALNILLAFGIIAVAGGTIALFQSSVATIFLGLILAVVGGGVCIADIRKWKLLGRILLPLGALTAAGGIIAATHGTVLGFLAVAILFLFGAIAARSGLLVSLSVFALLSALGGTTGYDEACYFLCIKQPLLTVIVFTFLALAAYLVSLYTSAAYASLATIFSRTAMVVVNFGFWVGSLWGDRSSDAVASDWYFIIAWAVILLAAGGWAAWRGLRWLVNLTATFGAIHLYTQWFEHFHANPGSVIIAGVFTIAIAYALICYNRRMKQNKIAT